MRVGDYGVEIPEGRPLNIDGVTGYYALRHGEQFSIQLINYTDSKCVAEVYIENDSMGKPILSSLNGLRLEGKIGSGQRFTIYKSGTAEAIKVGEQVLAPAEKGHIKVIFYPEKQIFVNSHHSEPARRSRAGGQSASYSSKNLSAGVVGLSGKSNQKFQGVSFDADYQSPTEINLRLVIETSETNEPQPISARRSSSNPIPPAL
jgi:hypothetical protein